MKIPVTDKFLWDIYNVVEKIDKFYEPVAMRTMKEAISPDLYKLRCEWSTKMEREKFSKLIYYLKKRGLIKIENLKGRKGVMLTPSGKEKILKVKLKFAEKKKREDGKWIMIIFDIPERKRKIRDLFRERLQELGYQKLQKSIWVCPYDVFEDTEELVRNYLIDFYVRIFLIEEITTK